MKILYNSLIFFFNRIIFSFYSILKFKFVLNNSLSFFIIILFKNAFLFLKINIYTKNNLFLFINKIVINFIKNRYNY